MRRVLFLIGLGFPFLATSASTRTWYVAADGSGDAPSIAAAVDSSVSGDVILVGPGTHLVSSTVGDGVTMKSGTSLISEAGPEVTFLKPGSAPFQPGLVSTRDNCVVSGFSIVAFGISGATAPILIGANHVEASNNIIHTASGAPAIAVSGAFVSIHHNICDGDGVGIYLAYAEGADIYRNIVLNGITDSGLCLGIRSIHCNLINGSSSTCPNYYDNFSADPMFCGATNYHLQGDSPCAPGNHPDGIDCGLIGPLPVGCGPVTVETRTWGSIKAMYRD